MQEVQIVDELQVRQLEGQLTQLLVLAFLYVPERQTDEQNPFIRVKELMHC